MLDQNNRPKTWEVLKSETRVKDRWINVRTDKCRATNGDIVDYHVLSYPNWVNVIAFEAETNQLIFVDEYRHGIGTPVFGLAGGAVDKETGLDADDAAFAGALRELAEETGHSAQSATLVLKSMANPALQDNWVYSYIAFDAVDAGAPTFDEGNGEYCLTIKRNLIDVLRDISNGKLHMQAMHVAALWAAVNYIAKSEDLPASATALREEVCAFLLS